EIHERSVHRQLAAPNAIEERLQLVRQLGDDDVSHRRAHPLHRMNGAKNRAHRLGAAGGSVALELEEPLVNRRDVLATLREEEIGVLGGIHGRGASSVERWALSYGLLRSTLYAPRSTQ